MSLIKLAVEKHAGFWGQAAKFGSGLMQNKVVRNAAIGTGIGAAVGAIGAKDGERMSGALKGGLLGGVVGGGTTFGKGVYDVNKMNKGLAAARGTTAPGLWNTVKGNATSLKDDIVGAWKNRAVV